MPPRAGRKELGLEWPKLSPHLRVAWNSSAEAAARSLVVPWTHKLSRSNIQVKFILPLKVCLS